MSKFFKICLLVLCMCTFALNAQYVSTTATRIKTDFESKWADKSFPRLFGNGSEMQYIKDLYASGDVLVKKSVDKIIAEANSALSKSIPVWGLDAANLRVSSVHTIAKEFLPQLTIAYYFTGDQKYARRAWDVAKVLMTYQDWGVAVTSPFKDRHFLDAGIGAFNAAMLYDGLSGWTTQAQKDSLFNMTKKYIFIPAQAQYNGSAQRTWSWMSSNNNWNGICNGGVLSACLVMFEHDKTLLSDVASRAINFLPNYINAFEPDGQSEEGLMYWSYGLMYTTTAFDIMKRVLGSTYGYGETNGMKKTGYFPVYTSGPVATLNVGDDGVRSSRVNSMFWFSKHHNDSTLAKFAYDLFMENGQVMNWFDLYHYSPTLVNKGKELKVGTDNYIRGIDLYTFVEKWNDKNALYLAVHAGSNKANHGHLDAGSFYIQGLGEYWAYGNLGSDSYTNAGYFDFGAGNNDCLPSYSGTNYTPTVSQSWHFYRKRAEGKNAVVYNPDFRADQDPTQEAVYKGFINSSEKTGCGVINMNMIYSRDVNTHTRGFKLDRTRRMITIQDNIAAKATKNIWWSMHTRAAVVLSTDKRTATLTQNGKSMKFVLRSPDNTVFQTLSATYLEGRTFPLTTNSSNSNYRKLAVNLKDTKDVTIRIEAYPAEMGEQEEQIDDFEGFSYPYTAVSSVRIETNVVNPVKDATNGSDLVMRVTKLAGAADLSGIKLSNKNITAGLGAGQYRYVKVKLLKATAGKVKLLLTPKGGGASVELTSVQQPVANAGQWKEYSFDLLAGDNASGIDGTTFDMISIIPEESAGQDIITYVDDIRLSKVIDDKPENIAFSQQKVNGLEFSKRTSSSVMLRWNSVPAAVSYNIYKDKMLFTTVSDSSFLVPGLAQDHVYKFSVTARNTNDQPSVSSDEISFPLRKIVNGEELVDDFETAFVPWTGTVSGVTLYPDQVNPLKNIVNNSSKSMKISRLAFTGNETGMQLNGSDLFNISELPRFLHVKLYRGAVVGGVAVELSEASGSGSFRVAKPINEADTLVTLKWVDFVFDLGSAPVGKQYENLKIYPDLTATYSSTKNYFIDDIRFSAAGVSFTSTNDLKLNPGLFALVRVGTQIHFKSVNQSAAEIQVTDLSGRLVKVVSHPSGQFETIISGLSRGMYVFRVSADGCSCSEKVLL